MKSKKKQIPKERKLFSNRKLAILVIALVAVIVSGFLLFQFLLKAPEVEFSFKAAIIDQVGDAYPSSPSSAREFNETVTNLLEKANFTVSYHRSQSITVDFYKGLAKGNYGLIILRAHSALRQGESFVDFFTSEEFEEDNTYAYVTVAHYPWQPSKNYFAITPEFIEKNLEGYFPKSIIIAMGCNSLNATCKEMAEAFIGRGAKAYIGWTSDIGLSHSDNSTIRFLQYFLVNNMTISQAINECNKISDPEFFLGKLSYYPSEIGDYKLSDFTAKTLSSSLLLVTQTRLLWRKEKSYYFNIAA
jgi:hypothetical protein